MNSGMFKRAVLALSAGLGIVAGLARAQDVRPTPVGNGSIPPATLPGTIIMPPYTPGPHPQTPPAHPLLEERLHRYGLHCFAEINSLGCGSWKSDFQFVFGSCHTFYGQPCIPQPPHDTGILGRESGILGRTGAGCGCP
jgi:hypothetical protein